MNVRGFVLPVGGAYRSRLTVDGVEYGRPASWPNAAGAIRHLAQRLRVLEAELPNPAPVPGEKPSGEGR